MKEKWYVAQKNKTEGSYNRIVYNDEIKPNSIMYNNMNEWDKYRAIGFNSKYYYYLIPFIEISKKIKPIHGVTSQNRRRGFSNWQCVYIPI